MKATQLLAVHLLTTEDVIQLGNEPILYRVASVEQTRVGPGSRCKVSLRSVEGLAAVMLVRMGHEQLLVVPRERPQPPASSRASDKVDGEARGPSTFRFQLSSTQR